MSNELGKLSECLWEIQQRLYESHGIGEIYLTGAGCASVFDHVWHGKPLREARFTLAVANNANVRREIAQRMAETLRGPDQPRQGVAPQIRSHPSSTKRKGYTYLTGWSFPVELGDHRFEVVVHHSKDGFNLDSIFSFDRLRLRLSHEDSLLAVAVTKLAGRSYSELIEKGIVEDAHGGYSDWQHSKSKVVNWAEVRRLEQSGQAET